MKLMGNDYNFEIVILIEAKTQFALNGRENCLTATNIIVMFIALFIGIYYALWIDFNV